MKKRLLAIAMSLTMTLSLLPVSAFAGPMDETVEMRQKFWRSLL